MGILVLVKVIKLTKTTDESVIFNWSNVTHVINVRDSFGNEYGEVYTAQGLVVHVQESVDDIESILIN